AEPVAGLPAQALDVGQRLVAVLRRFARAQQVEVGTVEDEDLLHGGNGLQWVWPGILERACAVRAQGLANTPPGYKLAACPTRPTRRRRRCCACAASAARPRRWSAPSRLAPTAARCCSSSPRSAGPSTPSCPRCWSRTSAR